MSTPGAFRAEGAITQAGNQVLHAGNYNSYALSKTEGYAYNLKAAGNTNSSSYSYPALELRELNYGNAQADT